MTTVGVSANRLEILQIAKAVAEEKSIDQRIVIEAMQEAIEKAAKAKYGQEHDIRARIDPATGEQTLWRVQTVVSDENFEDEAKQLRLAEAKKIDATLTIGSELKEELPPFDFGRVAAQIQPAQVVVQVEVRVVDPLGAPERVAVGDDPLAQPRNRFHGTVHADAEDLAVRLPVEEGEVGERRRQLWVTFELPHQRLEAAHLVALVDWSGGHGSEANQRTVERDAEVADTAGAVGAAGRATGAQRGGGQTVAASCASERPSTRPANTSLAWWTPTWTRLQATTAPSDHQTGPQPRSRVSSVAAHAAAEACPLGNEDVRGARSRGGWSSRVPGRSRLTLDFRGPLTTACSTATSTDRRSALRRCWGPPSTASAMLMPCHSSEWLAACESR